MDVTNIFNKTWLQNKNGATVGDQQEDGSIEDKPHNQTHRHNIHQRAVPTNNSSQIENKTSEGLYIFIK